MDINRIRTRWAAVGAAVAITLGAGGIGITHATTSSGAKPIYISINPCRLVDLRPAPFTVGPRTAGIGPAETITFDGWGTVGNCSLPTGTAGLALNVTAVSPSLATDLRLWAADGAVPVTSNLNPAPGQPPTPNAVNVGLSTSGQFKILNKFGTVSVIIDVVGVYDDHNHDDMLLPGRAQTYTKAQVDALIAPFTNSVAAYAGGQQMITLTSTDDTYRSVSLMPPADGTVIVTSSAYIYNTSGLSVIARCVISEGTTINGEPGYFQYANMPATNGSEVMSGTRGFMVTEGALLTVNLVCDTFSGTATVNDSSLTAVFAPS